LDVLAIIKNLVSSFFLSKNQNLQFYLLYYEGGNFVSHTNGKYKPRVFQKILLNVYLDLREKNYQEAGENCVLKSFIIYTLHQILLELSYQGGWDRWDM